MAKRKKVNHSDGLPVQFRVSKPLKRRLGSLCIALADDVPRDRLMGVGVMCGYAALYLLTLSKKDALKAVLAGQALEEATESSEANDPASHESGISGRRHVVAPAIDRTKSSNGSRRGVKTDLDHAGTNR